MFHENPIIALEKAIMHAHNQIIIRSKSNPDLQGMGTTCVVVLYRNDDVYLGHVGDSRIYCITDNSLKRLTKDHSFVQKLVDQGELTDDQMELHPRKNELTQALGSSGAVLPTISSTPIKLKQGDKLLLCSDGLCGFVTDDIILDKIIDNNN